jgi:hypothetical protein
VAEIVQDYLTRQGQARALQSRAAHQHRLHRARVYAAYVNLAKTEAWEIFLTDLIDGVLLRPVVTDVDRGRQHLVLEILRHQTLAVSGQQAPLEPTMEYVLGGVEA